MNTSSNRKKQFDPVTSCDRCGRAGKLVGQTYMGEDNGKPFVFRAYLCPWHVAAANRHNEKIGSPFRVGYIEPLPDELVKIKWIERINNRPKILR